MESEATPAPTATGFLAALEESERSDLLERAGRRRYRRGTVVFHEGGGSDEIVVVLAGRVKVRPSRPDGKEIVLAFRGPGDLLVSCRRSTVRRARPPWRAIESVEVIAPRRPEFRLLTCSRHPRVRSILLLEMLARRLRDAVRSPRRVRRARHARQRVAARLVELAERRRRAGRRTVSGSRLPLSQEELAGWTGRRARRWARRFSPARARLGAHRAPQHHRPATSSRCGDARCESAKGAGEECLTRAWCLFLAAARLLAARRRT